MKKTLNEAIHYLADPVLLGGALNKMDHGPLIKKMLAIESN